MIPTPSNDTVNFNENSTDVQAPPNPLSPKPRRRTQTETHTGETPMPVVGRRTAYIPNPKALNGSASAQKDPLFEALLNSLDRLYSAENLVDLALPPFADAVSDPALKDALGHYLTRLPDHLHQLNLIEGILGAFPRQGACLEMEAFIASGNQIIHENHAGAVRDFGLLCTAHQMLDYQVISYSGAQNFAISLGLADIANRLQATLEEKFALVTKLAALADRAHYPAHD